MYNKLIPSPSWQQQEDPYLIFMDTVMLSSESRTGDRNVTRLAWADNVGGTALGFMVLILHRFEIFPRKFFLNYLLKYRSNAVCLQECLCYWSSLGLHKIVDSDLEAHICNLTTRGRGRKISPSSEPPWSEYRVPDQQGLYSETLSKTKINTYKWVKRTEEGREVKKGGNYLLLLCLTLSIKPVAGEKTEKDRSVTHCKELIQQVIKSAEQTSHVSVRPLNQPAGRDRDFQTFWWQLDQTRQYLTVINTVIWEEKQGVTFQSTEICQIRRAASGRKWKRTANIWQASLMINKLKC